MEAKVKDFLNACRHIDARISGKVDEQTRWRELATKITPTYSDMPCSSHDNTSKIETSVQKLVDLEQEINDEVDELVERKRISQRVIGSLKDDRQRDILTWRYFDMWNWDKIAMRLERDRMTVWRIHGIALIEAQRVYDQIRSERSA